MRSLKWTSAFLVLITFVLGALGTKVSIAAPVVQISPPDIIVQSKVDDEWSGYLIERLRIFFANARVLDPFNHEFKKNQSVAASILPADLPADQKILFDGLAQSLGMDFEHSKINVVTHGLSYGVGKVAPEIRPVKTTNGHLQGMQVDLDLSFSDLRVAAKSIDFSLSVAPKDGSASFEFIKITLNNPSVRVDPEAVLGFACRLEPAVGSTMSFKVIQSSFADISQFMSQNSGRVTLDPGVLVMDPITIRGGSRTQVVTAEKIQGAIQENQELIKRILMSQFAGALTSGLGDKFLNLVFDQNYPSDIWMPSQIYSRLKLDAINDEPFDQISMALSGSFCAPADFTKYGKFCEQHQKVWPDVRETSEIDFSESKKLIAQVLNDTQDNLVASASEQYINRLIRKTIDNGLWNKILPKGAKMGPLGAFVVLDEPGESFGFYVDMLYSGNKLNAVALGKKEIRIPLSMKIGMKIVNYEVGGKSMPAISFVIHSADTSRAFLMRGLPQYGLTSDIPDIRFKKMVAKLLKKKIAPYLEKEILKIDFTRIEGLGLDQAVFSSDGHGRALAKLHVGPLTPR